jgi:polygalacturonase
MIKRIRICQSVVVSLSGIILLFATSAQASGDRRVVQPPQLSQPVCTTLSPEAHQSSTSVQHRLQQALNQCPAGQAVRLTSGPQGNTFKSGPLQIPSGVFLRLDAGSVLLADNDPRRYDTGQGHCGTIDQKGAAAGLLFLWSTASAAGLKGKGRLMGREVNE